MEIKATFEELQKALAKVNEKYENNIEFNRIDRKNNTTYIVTLRVKDASKLGKGRKLNQYYAIEGYKRGIFASNGSACWHVHGDFFDALFAINSLITIKSRENLITSQFGNWQDFNIGSIMYPIYASECCNCNKKTLLDELKEADYEIGLRTKNVLVLSKSQYLDNGYGFYFDANIELRYNFRKEEVTQIKIDDYTKRQIEKLIEKTIQKCKFYQKYDECAENELCGVEFEANEDLVDYQLCNDCQYLNMIQQLYESVNEGNW